MSICSLDLAKNRPLTRAPVSYTKLRFLIGSQVLLQISPLTPPRVPRAAVTFEAERQWNERNYRSE